MRDKYIEERHPMWFSMTTTKDDISDSREVAFATAQSKEDAKTINEKHNELVRALLSMARAFDEAAPDEFSKYWYGQEEEL